MVSILKHFMIVMAYACPWDAQSNVVISSCSICKDGMLDNRDDGIVRPVGAQIPLGGYYTTKYLPYCNPGQVRLKNMILFLSSLIGGNSCCV